MIESADIVLGIDPGTAVTGYGVLRRGSRGTPVLLECGVIRTKTSLAFASRLKNIHDGITELIERHKPNSVAVESIFYARNARTTVVLGHTRGVILLAAEQAGIPIHELAPTEIKKAITGRGAASKEQIQFMTARLLRLASPPQPSDAADGVAAALAVILSPQIPKLSDLIPGRS